MRKTGRNGPMKPRPAVRFRSSIPDEDVEDERGETIFRGGAVARVLRELLITKGFQCQEPDYGGDHGWEFLANSPARSLGISVISAEGGGEDYYLVVEDLPSWSRIL